MNYQAYLSPPFYGVHSRRATTDPKLYEEAQRIAAAAAATEKESTR